MAGFEVFVALVPESPIRVGSVKPGGQFLETLPYIPGSVLRGALAEFLKEEGREEEIRGVVSRIRFGNLFPSSNENLLSLSFPITAVTCKAKGGFLRVPRGEEHKAGHGVVDLLIPSLAYLEMERLGARFPVPFAPRCGHDECRRGLSGRLEPVKGFYVEKEGGYAWVEIRYTVQTKVALSPRRGAAQERMLYRVVALERGGVFVGRVWLEEEDDLGLLGEAVAQCGVGALTTRGYGRARLQESRASLPPLEERVRAFNRHLKEKWEELRELARGEVPKEPPGTYFSVDLLSPAVLTDRHGLPTLRLELPLFGNHLDPVHWAARPASVGGWSTAWGLPKPTSLAACQGSTYVFRTERPVKDLLPHLEELEREGVGDRTDEGLGEVLICHPFHREVEQT